MNTKKYFITLFSFIIFSIYFTLSGVFVPFIVKVKSFAPRQIQRRLFAALVTLSRKVFRPWHKWF